MKIEFRLLILFIAGIVGILTTIFSHPILLKEYNEWHKFCAEEKNKPSGVFHFILKRILLIFRVGIILFIPIVCYAAIWLGGIIFTLFILDNENVSNISFYLPYLITLLIGVSAIIIIFFIYLKNNKNKKIKLLFWKDELNIFYKNNDNDIKRYNSFIWFIKFHWILIFPISLLLSVCEFIGNIFA